MVHDYIYIYIYINKLATLLVVGNRFVFICNFHKMKLFYSFPFGDHF